MTKILYKSELVHPIFVAFIFAGIVGIVSTKDFSLLKFWEKDISELLPEIITVFVSYFTWNALNISKVVMINNQHITKGIYCKPFGFIKVYNKMNVKDIKEIRLKQNEKLYYEVTVESLNNELLVVKSIANKFPAQDELKAIEEEIRSY
ncbi:MAG: hypothetical protein EVB11_02250 [Winogradskyella sp.]|nr:MAG: hypothetical protein EVB11_02250 [Winogradskyella sp.]